MEPPLFLPLWWPGQYFRSILFADFLIIRNLYHQVFSFQSSTDSPLDIFCLHKVNLFKLLSNACCSPGTRDTWALSAPVHQQNVFQTTVAVMWALKALSVNTGLSDALWTLLNFLDVLGLKPPEEFELEYEQVYHCKINLLKNTNPTSSIHTSIQLLIVKINN